MYRNNKIYFIGFDIIFIILIAAIAFIAIVFDFIGKIFMYFISGFLFVGTFILLIFHIKNQKKKSISFWISLLTTVLYIPFLIFLIESSAVDKSNEIFISLNSGNFAISFISILILVMFIIIIPQLLSYIPNKIVNRFFCTLPIILGVIITVFILNKVGDSYNKYNLERYCNNKYITTTVINDADIYIKSNDNPEIIYPLLSPYKLTNGCIKPGDKVKVIDYRNDNYVRIIYSNKFGYIKRNLLRNKNTWKEFE